LQSERTAHASHRALHDCKAYPRTREFLAAVQSFKDLKNTILMPALDPDSIVRDCNPDPISVPLGLDYNLGRDFLPTKLEPVGNKVAQHLTYGWFMG
jgi:hypothetical protein